MLEVLDLDQVHRRVGRQFGVPFVEQLRVPEGNDLVLLAVQDQEVALDVLDHLEDAQLVVLEEGVG